MWLMPLSIHRCSHVAGTPRSGDGSDHLARNKAWPWQSLNFFPLPQGQGALRGVLSQSDFTTGARDAAATSSTWVGAPSTWAWVRASVDRPPDCVDGSAGPDVRMFDTAGSSDRKSTRLNSSH